MPMIVSQFTRYVIVGVMNTILDFLILNGLSIYFDTYSGAPIILFNSISAAIVIGYSYFWNKYWTFRATDGSHRVELPKFIAVNVGAFFLNTTVVYSLTTFVAPPLDVGPLAWENVAKTIALGGNVIWNFLGFKYFVFGSTSGPATVSGGER
jgi:putative flippase GtrA